MFQGLREAARRLGTDAFAFTFLRQASVAIEDHPIVAGGMLVSGNYFSAMRVPMSLGRGLDDSDDREGAPPAVVLSHALWRRGFGGDPSALGRTLRINGRPFTVVGVTAPRYFGVSNGGFFPPADVTVALHAQPAVSPRWNPSAGSLLTAEPDRPSHPHGRVLSIGSDRDCRHRARQQVRDAQRRGATDHFPAVCADRRYRVDGGGGADQRGRRPAAPHSQRRCRSGSRPAGHRPENRAGADRRIARQRADVHHLLVFFGGFALVLACIGLHGVTSYAVARRTSEIGVRMALGAQRGQVLWLVLRQVVVLAAIGLAVGIPVAAAASRSVRALLFGVEPMDPWSLAAGAIAMLAVALASGYLPARRAARLDPLVALRRE